MFSFFKKKPTVEGPILIDDGDSNEMKHYILLINVALRTAKNIDEFKNHLSTLKLPRVLPAQNAPTVKGIEELDAFKLLSTFVTTSSEIIKKIERSSLVPHIVKELLDDPKVSELNKQNLVKMHNITSKTRYEKSHRQLFYKNLPLINKIKAIYAKEWERFKTSKLNRDEFIHSIFAPENLYDTDAKLYSDEIYEYNDFFYEVYLRLLVTNGTSANTAIDNSVPNWPMIFKYEIDEDIVLYEVPHIVKVLLQDNKNKKHILAKEFPIINHLNIDQINFADDPAPEPEKGSKLDKNLMQQIKKMYQKVPLEHIHTENLSFKLANDNPDFNHFFNEIDLRTKVGEPKNIAIKKTMKRWEYLFHL